MSRIEKLTEEQIAKLVVYRDKWLGIGLSTRQADKAKAVEAAKAAYRVANQPEPKIFIWLDSPLAGTFGAHMLASLPDQVGDQVLDQVRDQVGVQVMYKVRAQVRAQVFEQVLNQVGAQVGDQVMDQVRDQVRAQVGDQVRDQVRDQIWEQVRDQVWAQVWDQVRDQVYRAGYGLHDANWLGFYNYFLEMCELSCCSSLKPLMDLAENCGWWWPFQGTVILTEKPLLLSRDSQNRLHNEDGKKAIEYKDGFGIWANHGVRLPEKYGSIPSKFWQSKWLLEEGNAELRMVLIRALGYDKIVQELDAKRLDKWREYELIRIDNADIEPIVLLKMTCPSTGKIHALRVPPDTEKARSAITMCNHGVDPESFIAET